MNNNRNLIYLYFAIVALILMSCGGSEPEELPPASNGDCEECTLTIKHGTTVGMGVTSVGFTIRQYFGGRVGGKSHHSGGNSDDVISVPCGESFRVTLTYYGTCMKPGGGLASARYSDEIIVPGNKCDLVIKTNPSLSYNPCLVTY